MNDPENYDRLYRNLELIKRIAPSTYARIQDWAADRKGPRIKSFPGEARAAQFRLARPNRDKIDVHMFRFLETAFTRATAEGIAFLERPRVNRSYYLLIFGLGDGVNPEALATEMSSYEVFIIEPEIERLWHSLETYDWVTLFDGLTAKGGKLHFVLSDDPDGISGAVWRTIRRTNPCITDGLVCLVHGERPFAEATIDNLSRQIRLIVSNLGFFYDETLMLWNTHRNLGTGSARIYTRDPENRRDIPVFVIGSGPSLDGDMDFLRDNQHRAVVVSCGSALRPLLVNGIKPDFQIEMENIAVSPLIEQVSRDFDLSDICLVTATTVEPDALTPFSNIVYFFRFSLSPYPIFCDTPEHTLHLPDPSVTNAGLCFGQELGFREFYFFGTDFGSRSEAAHHSADAFQNQPDGVATERDTTFHYTVDANFGGDCFTSRDLYTVRDNFIDAVSIYAQGRSYTNCADGASIPGAEPRRATDIELADPAQPKSGTVEAIIAGFPVMARDRFEDAWRGSAIGEAIEAYSDALAAAMNAIEDFEDKSYQQRLMAVFEPVVGNVEPPTGREADSVNLLFRGTLYGMLIFMEYYLARVADGAHAQRFGEIVREEYLRRFARLKEIATASLAGPEPVEPPPFDGGTAPPGEMLPDLLRPESDAPCPCGSGAAYQDCHGAP